MSTLPTLLNNAWMLACRREAGAFAVATRSVAEAQAAVLAGIVRANRETRFGRAHGFDRIDGPRAFRERVRPSTYEDYAADVEAIGRGEAGVLTAEPVEVLEPTSGTTGGEKLIPFTASLRRQFQRAVSAWMYDLLRNRPAVRRGRAYWSISPAAVMRRTTSGGVRVGFNDDAEYLGLAERWALTRLLAVPSDVVNVADMQAFRYCTLWHLLRAEDLALVSVWNPTFLTVLLDGLEGWADRLCADVERGRPEPPAPLPEGLSRRWAGRPMPQRAGEVRKVMRASAPLHEKLRQVWPRLAMINCWADAGAAQYIGRIRELFPHVELQPKGLLATEGCVSFPLLGRPGTALAVRSHFFEFEEADGAQPGLRLAHELDTGGRYRVLLTTGGGLYRYQLRDEIEVVGFEEQCPLLRFVGKSDCVSDLVGEKLAEPHVREVVKATCDRHRLSPTFALVVPAGEPPPHYRLYLQLPAGVPRPDPGAVAESLDAGLSQNPHYAYARRLGQLGPASVHLLDPHGDPGWVTYERQCLARGMRAGNIKPAALDRWPGWPAVFGPRVTAPPAQSWPAAAAENP